MPDKLVTIAQFTDLIQAELAKQLLDDFGIKSVIAGQHAANTYAGVPAIASVELQVFESQAQKALEILESNEKQEE